MKQNLTTLITKFLGFKTLDGLELVVDKEVNALLPYLDKENKTIHIPSIGITLLLISQMKDYKNYLTLYYASKMLTYNEYELSEKLLKDFGDGIKTVKKIPKEICDRVKIILTMLLYREVGRYQMSMDEKMKSELLETVDEICSSINKVMNDEKEVEEIDSEIRKNCKTSVEKIARKDLEMEEEDYEEIERDMSAFMDMFSIKDSEYCKALDNDSSVRDDIAADLFAIDKMFSSEQYKTEETPLKLANIWTDFFLFQVNNATLDRYSTCDDDEEFTPHISSDSVRFEIILFYLQHILEQNFNVSWELDFQAITIDNSDVLSSLMQSFFELDEVEEVSNVIKGGEVNSIDESSFSTISKELYNCSALTQIFTNTF